MTSPDIVRIATRASRLARWQAQHVAELLRQQIPQIQISMVPVQSEGDLKTDRPLEQLGGTGLFTKAIQQVVLEGLADVAVHSLKDLPTEPAPGLEMVAVPSRGRVEDVLVTRTGEGFESLAPGSRVATSSPRRRALLEALRPDLTVVDVRGNVPTRLAKLDEGQFEGIVLARAGLVRLGLEDRIHEVFDPLQFPPAPGQGALAVEVRRGESEFGDLLRLIDDPSTRAAVTAERTLLARLEGGCRLPVGAWSRFQGDCLHLEGAFLPAGDSCLVRASGVMDNSQNEKDLGVEVANKLLARSCPLKGRTVLVTRARHQAEELVCLLEERGARVELFSSIAFQEPESWSKLDGAITRLDSFDWLLWTSSNAVERVFGRFPDLGVRLLKAGVRVAAVGEATAGRVREQGGQVDLVSRVAHGAAMARELAPLNIAGTRFLLPRAEQARLDLPRALVEAGAAEVCEVVVYRTVVDGEGREEEIGRMLEKGQIDWLTFTSGSAVEAFMELVGKESIDGSRQNVQIATIGPRTSEVVQTHGGAVLAEASRASVSELVASIARVERRR
ncbi:MAG: hydroxymethylbilane synthase [Planctomycetota bacterium]|nr:hydroxymethylbilane synthase [Planctomycetota bacterium]